MQKDASQKSLVQRNCRYSKTIARPRAETLTDTDHCRSDARHSSTTTTLESAPAPVSDRPDDTRHCRVDRNHSKMRVVHEGQRENAWVLHIDTVVMASTHPMCPC